MTRTLAGPLMSKSARLRDPDTRALIDLVGECRDLGDDPAVWRTHLCRRVARLIGAEVVFCGEIAGVRTGRLQVGGQADWGLDRGLDRTTWDRAIGEFVADPRHQPLYLAALAGLVRSDGPISMNRMLGDRSWHRSYLYQVVYATVGLEANLYSLVRLARGADEDTMLYAVRAAGGRAFTDREARVIQEVQSVVAAGVGGPLARFTDPSPSALPPRPRQVLKCLLEGDSDKQVARRLGLSPYTVNQYTKTIYRHFGVTTRAELLARWVRRGWSATCRWADPD